jgi:hypothetical protein
MTPSDRRAGDCKHDLPLATCLDCTPAPGFGDRETVTVGDLRQGDWVDHLPAQRRYRAATVQSGIKHIDASYRWYEQSRPRGPKMPIPASKITFLNGTSLDIPRSWSIVRRQRTSN